MLGLFLVLPAARTGVAQSDEYRVKAAFLYHFTQLVDWPADAQGANGKSIAICTLGGNPFGGDLEATLQGKTIGSRPLEIRHLKRPEEAPGCLAVFIAGDRKQMAQTLAVLKDSSVLTVGESADFAKQGGMIGFCMESDDKVRFVINVEAAAQAKLKISARLLMLAKTVIGGHP